MNEIKEPAAITNQVRESTTMVNEVKLSKANMNGVHNYKYTTIINEVKNQPQL